LLHQEYQSVLTFVNGDKGFGVCSLKGNKCMHL